MPVLRPAMFRSMAAAEPRPDEGVVTLEGEIDLNVTPALAGKFTPLIERQAEKIVVDLSGVTYMDSSGIAVLIDALQKVQAYGGKLILSGIRENVRKIFEIARLDKVFQLE